MTHSIATLHKTDGAGVISAVQALQQASIQNLYLPQAPGLWEPMELAGYAAATPTKVRFFVGQKVGFIAPTMCSRMFATLDQLHDGRVTAVLDISALEVSADGAAAGDLPRRATEYAQIMRSLWGADQSLTHEGAFYKFNKARTVVPPTQRGEMPIFLAAPLLDAVRVDASAFDGLIVAADEAEAAMLPSLKNAFKSVYQSVSVADMIAVA